MRLSKEAAFLFCRGGREAAPPESDTAGDLNVFAKLEEVESRYEQVNLSLQRPDIASDQKKYRALMKELSELEKIRSVTTFAPNVGALQQAVAADQVDMFFLPDSRLVPQLADGDDLTIVWDVTVASINAFAVPKGSTKKAAVEKFLASVMEPGPVAKISELLGVAPINMAAKLDLNEYASQVEVYNPKTNPGITVLQDIPWYAENFNDASTKLTNWLAG